MQQSSAVSAGQRANATGYNLKKVTAPAAQFVRTVTDAAVRHDNMRQNPEANPGVGSPMSTNSRKWLTRVNNLSHGQPFAGRQGPRMRPPMNTAAGNNSYAQFNQWHRQQYGVDAPPLV